MSRRIGHHAIVREQSPSAPSPNSTVAQISAEVRLFYPPGTDHGHLKRVLQEAINKILTEMKETS